MYYVLIFPSTAYCKEKKPKSPLPLEGLQEKGMSCLHGAYPDAVSLRYRLRLTSPDTPGGRLVEMPRLFLNA